MRAKQFFAVLAIGLGGCLAGPLALAQDDASREARMEEARERLKEAARELAELGTQMAGDTIEIFRDVRIEGKRAFLGINVGGPAGDSAEGVTVHGVSPGGPAEQAGIRAGDVLLGIDGVLLVSENGGSGDRKLLDYLAEVEPGDTVSIDYLRDGRRENVRVKTESFNSHRFAFAFGDEDFEFNLPDFSGVDLLERLRSRWGTMELASLSPALGEYFGTDEGLLVVRAPQDDAIDLRDGDVILRIDGRQPSDPQHAMRILRSYSAGETLTLEIVRQQRRMSVTVDLAKTDAPLRRSSLRLPAHPLPAPAVPLRPMRPPVARSPASPPPAAPAPPWPVAPAHAGITI